MISQNPGDNSPGEEISGSESQSIEIGGEKHAKRTPSPFQSGLNPNKTKIFHENAIIDSDSGRNTPEGTLPGMMPFPSLANKSVMSNLSELTPKILRGVPPEPDMENSPGQGKNVNLNFSVDTKNYINLQIDQSKKSKRINQVKITRQTTNGSKKKERKKS